MSDYKKAPCGCEMWHEGEVFKIKPCSLDCPTYHYVLEKSRERGNKMVYK